MLPSLIFRQGGKTFIPCPLTARTAAPQMNFLTPPPLIAPKTTPLIVERTAFGWRVKAPRITAPIVWRRIPTIITHRDDSHLCSEGSLPHSGGSASAPTCNTLKKSPNSRRRKRSYSSSQKDKEELEEAALKLIKLTWRMIALTNRPSTMTCFSPRLTTIQRKRAALYKLCKELRRTNSSDSGRLLDSDPEASSTNSSGQTSICDPKHWRRSGTADSSPASSPRSEGRWSPDPKPADLPRAHLSNALPALANQFRDQLSFHSLDQGALDLRPHRPPPQ
jgi:hypothetical protein